MRRFVSFLLALVLSAGLFAESNTVTATIDEQGRVNGVLTEGVAPTDKLLMLIKSELIDCARNNKESSAKLYSTLQKMLVLLSATEAATTDWETIARVYKAANDVLAQYITEMCDNSAIQTTTLQGLAACIDILATRVENNRISAE